MGHGAAATPRRYFFFNSSGFLDEERCAGGVEGGGVFGAAKPVGCVDVVGLAPELEDGGRDDAPL
jgi:hypothetical protein